MEITSRKLRLFEVPKPDSKGHKRGAKFGDGYQFLAIMSGRAISRATVIGRVAVVRNKEDMSRVKQGAVVVSETASPHLSLIMSKASAVVTERGGQTATASKLAAMQGIPALVGVAGLTETVAEGDLVRIDGANETIEILEFAA